jgi:HEAT repeat protein
MTYRSLVVLVLLALPARADDPIDSLMDRDPELPAPRAVTVFPKGLPAAWARALDRPEVDYRCQAALAIADARAKGMAGLGVTVPALVRELDRADQHPTARLAAAKALVALDAKPAAPSFVRLMAADDIDLREVIEPALAGWGYAPAGAVWLGRLEAPPYRRPAVLAARGLAALKDPAAVPRLREVMMSPDAPAAARLEVAKAVGVIRTAGGEADADRLAADPTPKGMPGRLAAAWVLRHHTGAEAVRRLQALARDPEPAVAAVALARLTELDPSHVLPLLPAVLGSPDAVVRGVGVEVLRQRPDAARVAMLGDRLSDPHPDVRSAARLVLAELAGKGGFRPAVIRELDRALAGADWRGKEQAAVLAGKLGHTPAAGRLVERLADPRPEVGIAAAWALRELRVPGTYPAVLRHVEASAGPGAVATVEADRRLTHLVQLVGAVRYAPADPFLRGLVPPAANARAGFRTRAAACWALGYLHEGRPDAELVRLFTGRLAAVVPQDVEDPGVRRMSAVALGRMRAADAVGALRKYYIARRPSGDLPGNACGWALGQITGEPYPAPGVEQLPDANWFLVPLDR